MALRRAENRQNRRVRIRRKIRGTDARPRLSIYRSLHHIYAQVISDDRGATLAAASTVVAGSKAAVESTVAAESTPAAENQPARSRCNLAAAKALGRIIADRCREKGINEVIFDRNGFLYHGRIKALAEAAREAGLKF